MNTRHFVNLLFVISVFQTCRTEFGEAYNDFDWDSVDLHSTPLPEVSNTSSENVKIRKARTLVLNTHVFYREARPRSNMSSGHTLLFLHSKGFTSKTWAMLGTLSLLASLGHRVVAVDLPGFGCSKDNFVGDRAKFMVHLLDRLSMINARPILVSPSFSGVYACPFLQRYPELLSGFVALSPVATELMSGHALGKLEIPTLIVYGELDSSRLRVTSLENLKVLPNSREVEIRGVEHEPYYHKPQEFHEIMFNFLRFIH